MATLRARTHSGSLTFELEPLLRDRASFRQSYRCKLTHAGRVIVERTEAVDSGQIGDWYVMHLAEVFAASPALIDLASPSLAREWSKTEAQVQVWLGQPSPWLDVFIRAYSIKRRELFVSLYQLEGHRDDWPVLRCFQFVCSVEDAVDFGRDLERELLERQLDDWPTSEDS